MSRHDDMMILPVDKRRDYFRKVYMIEMGRLHVAGRYAWSIDRLGEMCDKAVASILSRSVPIGPAYDATMKFFGLKTQKALFTFLEA